MSQPCAIVTCEQASRVLCHCCNKNLCLAHLSNHNNSTNYQSNSLTDQINILDEQLKILDINQLVDDGRQKLDKWRDDSFKKISRFYEKKYEELDRYHAQKVDEQRKAIDQLRTRIASLDDKQDVGREENINVLQKTIRDMKQKIGAFEQKGIQINIRSLLIENNLISFGSLKTQEFDLETLSSPYQTLDCSEKSGFGLISNGGFLLINQNSDLILYDQDLKVVQQSPWNHGVIRDMCWSSALAKFIVITENSKTFFINENNLSADCIEPMQNQLWMHCTCSNSSLYVTTCNNSVMEFSLLPSVVYSRRWDIPVPCKKNEYIKDIACNDDTLAVIVVPTSNKMVHLILRSLETFSQLFSIRLDIKQPSYYLPIRCCSLKCNEWLVIEANTSRLFHIDKDRKVKGTLSYDRPPHNVVLFGSRILAIRTESSINFHQLLY